MLEPTTEDCGKIRYLYCIVQSPVKQRHTACHRNPDPYERLMSAVGKSTVPSKSITTDPPYSVNRSLLLKSVPCSKDQPWFNPNLSSLYMCA